MEMQQPLLDLESGRFLDERDGHSVQGAGITRQVAGTPDLLDTGEIEWSVIQNLDIFFTRVYSYYVEKGFWVAITARITNLVAIGFTAVFSGFLALWVDWGALDSECLHNDTCDILDVVIIRHPLQDSSPLWSAARLLYLALVGAYWAWSTLHLLVDVHAMVHVRHFCEQRLGLSERSMQTVSWPDVIRRIVEVQSNVKLCVKKDLSEHDIVSRIMRKDNYLIGMLNKGILALNVPFCGGRRFMLTKSLEWNFRWGVLDHMLDETTFTIRPEFLSHPNRLATRFRRMAIANLVLSPFLFVFLLLHFFLRNAEQLYHHPSSVGARRWSPLAKWRLREFNELSHFIDHRLSASTAAAEKYIAQFPSPLVAHVARLVAFIAGSFAALALGAAFVDDFLLDRKLGGRTLVWWAAALGVILAVSRAFIYDEAAVAFHPDLAMLEVVSHTHHLPRHWRGRAHTREVQDSFQALFPFKAALLAEEMISVLLTPFVLYFSLPACSDAIVGFVRDHTKHVDGLGDVCSLAAFDLQRHGNRRYGSPFLTPQGARSRQGKMEKSLLSFATTYPGWDPGAAAKQLLTAVRPPQPVHGGMAPWQRQSNVASVHRPHFPFTAHISNSTSAPREDLPKEQPCARSPHSIFASADMGSSFQWAGGTTPGVGLPLWSAVAARSTINGSPSPAALAVQPADLDIPDRVAVTHILLQNFYEEQEDTELVAATAGGSGRAEDQQQQQQQQLTRGVQQEGRYHVTDARHTTGAFADATVVDHGPPQTTAEPQSQPRHVRAVPWARSTGTGSGSSRGSRDNAHPSTAPLSDGSSGMSDRGWATTHDRTHSHVSSSVSSADRQLSLPASRALVRSSSVKGSGPLTEGLNQQPLPPQPPPWPPLSSSDHRNTSVSSRDRVSIAHLRSSGPATPIDYHQRISEMVNLGERSGQSRLMCHTLQRPT